MKNFKLQDPPILQRKELFKTKFFFQDRVTQLDPD
jgi:hypothetical protein